MQGRSIIMLNLEVRDKQLLCSQCLAVMSRGAALGGGTGADNTTLTGKGCRLCPDEGHGCSCVRISKLKQLVKTLSLKCQIK